MVHRGTRDEAEIKEGAHITHEWKLNSNWSDNNAEFYKDIKLKVSCKAFFGKGEGPFKVPTWVGKCKAWDALAEEH